MVYRVEDEFSSWPFNAGMWKTGDSELLVGFMNIRCDYSNPKHRVHRRVETFGRIATVRSADSGATWGPVHTVVDNIRVEEELAYGVARHCDEPLDPTNSRQILTCWSTPNSSDREAKA